LADIIDMEEKRRVLAARRGFRPWRSHFSDDFHENTCSKDLAHTTLQRLIQPGENSMEVIYEFVAEVKKFGADDSFDVLDTATKMAVMDISLFILDQMRFECMRRLGWVESYETCNIPLIDLVEKFPEGFAHLQHCTPPLSSIHPLYPEYAATFDADRGAFIRRLIPQALEAFGKEE
jgi:hypothetical protein